MSNSGFFSRYFEKGSRRGFWKQDSCLPAEGAKIGNLVPHSMKTKAEMVKVGRMTSVVNPTSLTWAQLREP
jgi:hypothetical protein